MSNIKSKSISINKIVINQKEIQNIHNYNLFESRKLYKSSDKNLLPRVAHAPSLCLTKTTCNIIYSRVPRTRSSPNTSR